MGDRRLRFGRLSVYIEPRDIWVGVYVAVTAVYVCPLPLLVIKWERKGRCGWGCEEPEAAPGLGMCVGCYDEMQAASRQAAE